MEIKTFAQRQKAQYIYDTYFEPFSEYCIDFGLFDTLAFYGAITDADKHAKNMKAAGDGLFKSMEIFDKKMLKLNSKQ